MGNKINEQITNAQVRIVEPKEFIGLYDIHTAIKLCDEHDLDLIEISDKNDVSICKMGDYEKFLYELKKQSKDKNKTELKTIKLSRTIAENDLNRLIEQCKSFLSKGNQVKIELQLNGREMIFKNDTTILFLEQIQKLNEYGTPNKLPQFDGNKIITIINPTKRK